MSVVVVVVAVMVVVIVAVRLVRSAVAYFICMRIDFVLNNKYMEQSKSEGYLN